MASIQFVSEEDMNIHYSVFQPIYVAVVTVSQKIIIGMWLHLSSLYVSRPVKYGWNPAEEKHNNDHHCPPVGGQQSLQYT